MNPADLLPFHGHRLLTVPALLAGALFLFFVFKAGRPVTKLVLFLIAAACFAGAYWWYTNIRS